MSNDAENFWDNYLKNLKPGWGPVEKMKENAHGNILDVGCGLGEHLRQLRGCGNLFGIDVTNKTLETARKANPNITFIHAPAEKMPFDNNFFDLVFSIEVVEHLKDPKIMFNEVARVLKPGGIFIFQTPNYPIKRFYDLVYYLRGLKKSLADDPTHFTKKSSFWWEDLAKKYFTVQEAYVRNILFEKKIKSIASQKRNFIGKIIGQKIIIICKK